MAGIQSVTLNIYPAVSSYEQHFLVREEAALLFKVASFLAEDGESDIVQEASVGQCLIERGKSNLVIASYPSHPLDFDAICPGFKEAFTNNG